MKKNIVTPTGGVRIEITAVLRLLAGYQSLPSQETWIRMEIMA